MGERIRFALERFDSPRHRSHVAQLFSLGHLGYALTDSLEMMSYWLVSSGSARAGFERRASAEHLVIRAVTFAELF